MKTIIFGFPPHGRSLNPLTTSGEGIPSNLRDKVVEEFAAFHPRSYLLAFYDDETSLCGFYSGSGENSISVNDVLRVEIFNMLPAKGPGWTEVHLVTSKGHSGVGLYSTRYEESMVDWIRERIAEFSEFIGKPYGEKVVGHDC